MPNFIVLGTDTDAGKTTFSLIWMSAFTAEYAYFKPFETGESDSNTIQRLVPGATVLPTVMRFTEPVAPPLAARREQRSIPKSSTLTLPTTQLPILLETFGGPFSPLNEEELQLELIRHLSLPTILVTSSAVGAIGRTLSCYRAMTTQGIVPKAIVLLGDFDAYVEEQLGKYTPCPIFSLPRPTQWSTDEYQLLAINSTETLQRIEQCLLQEPPPNNLIARDRATIWHPYTSLHDPLEPLPVISAHDEYLHLADGRTLIDAISSWWTILHGHRPAQLVAALHEAVETLDHVIFGGATHPHAVTVAECLLETLPWPKGGRIFFSDNGSTAVEVALKMAYQWWVHHGEPQRTLFVGFENGYHGDTFGAMAVGRDRLFFGNYEPLLFNALQIPVDVAALKNAFQKHPQQIAGVIIEPLVQGAGGMQMHSPKTLAEIATVCQRHGAKLIIDEVMTAGRTGTWWAFEQAQISPDLICSSKTLAGGMLPLAVTLASPGIVNAFMTDDRTKMLFHGHSFTANPLACAVAAKNLQMMKSGDWLLNVHRITQFWRNQHDQFASIPGVREVRQQGTIFAIELNSAGGYLAQVGPKLKQYAIDHGVLLRPLGNVLYAMPPLCTSQTSLQTIRDVMLGAIRHLNPM